MQRVREDEQRTAEQPLNLRDRYTMLVTFCPVACIPIESCKAVSYDLILHKCIYIVKHASLPPRAAFDYRRLMPSLAQHGMDVTQTKASVVDCIERFYNPSGGTRR